MQRQMPPDAAELVDYLLGFSSEKDRREPERVPLTLN
jgi:hypothetical protein